MHCIARAVYFIHGPPVLRILAPLLDGCPDALRVQRIEVEAGLLFATGEGCVPQNVAGGGGEVGYSLLGVY